MPYNPNILRDVLRARKLSASSLSERLGIKPRDLERELGREPEPNQGILNDIAAELALPPIVFFMKAVPPLSDVLPDFRSSHPTPSPLQRETLHAIQLATAVQKLAHRLEVSGVSQLPKFTAVGREQIEQFAFHVRDVFRISLEDQAKARDAKVFYNVCRKKIENRGIFVLQASFPAADGSGFCLAHAHYPVIVVNTKNQTRGRRLFTLIHELAHVLLGESGISDPFIRQNVVETRCNYFAASFLAPSKYIAQLLGGFSPPADPSVEDVARMGRKLKISHQAAVLRLEELKVVNRGSHDKWLLAIHNQGNPDYTERGGGKGGPPPQEKVKLARYGFRFAGAFEQPLREGQISEINLYRATGLKPKYQSTYFTFANSIPDQQLRELELEDE